ncbi:MAG TPA: secretin N-terminal domain-containing protein, partial [Thermogutta sp.]|nr:secretin N-terminal domain-containing protein [Thermogutta sp.]
MHATLKGQDLAKLVWNELIRVVGLSLTWTTLFAIAMGADDRTFKAFSLQHASPGQVESVLRSLVSPGTEIIQDTAGRRILISGPETDLQIAASVVAALDRPQETSPQPPVAKPAVSQIKSYFVSRDRLQSMLAILQAQFANRSDVRITADERTSQILVLGPQDVHASVGGLLALGPTPSQTGTTSQGRTPLSSSNPSANLPAGKAQQSGTGTSSSGRTFPAQ